MLAQRLQAQGHAVRVTTSDVSKCDEIAALGCEPYVGDPDRIGTLMEALTGVTVVCWLFGSATDDGEESAALHDERLQMLFEKLVDSPVRGVVYEAQGSVASSTLENGKRIALNAQATWHIPVEFLTVDPEDQASWLDEASAAIEQLLAARH